MKIAFDENVPPVLVKVFKTLASEGDILSAEILSAREYSVPRAPSDVPWLEKFAEDGGKVVISGDKRMRSNLHERKALADKGFITFFFASHWNNEGPFNKSAMLLRWWPQIQETLRSAKPGQCFEMPYQWTGGKLREVTPPGGRKRKPGRKKKAQQVEVIHAAQEATKPD